MFLIGFGDMELPALEVVVVARGVADARPTSRHREA